MALSVENTGGSYVNTDITMTITNFVVTSANKLVVLVGVGAAAVVVSSIVYGSDNLVFVGALTDTTPWCRVEIWEKHNPTAQTANIVVTANNNAQLVAGAIGFIGAATSLGTFYSGEGNTANPSVTVVDSVNGDIVVSCLMTDVGVDGTTTENEVLIYEREDLGSDTDFNAQRKNASGGNTVCSWTSIAPLAGRWAAAGVAVKASAAAGKDYFISGGRNTLYTRNGSFGILTR